MLARRVMAEFLVTAPGSILGSLPSAKLKVAAASREERGTRRSQALCERTM